MNPNDDLSQVMYTLGELGGKVESGFKRLDERMDRFQTDHFEMHKRVSDLETWRTGVVAKISVVGSVCILIWGILATPISRFVSTMVGLQ